MRCNIAKTRLYTPAVRDEIARDLVEERVLGGQGAQKIQAMLNPSEE